MKETQGQGADKGTVDNQSVQQPYQVDEKAMMASLAGYTVDTSVLPVTKKEEGLPADASSKKPATQEGEAGKDIKPIKDDGKPTTDGSKESPVKDKGKPEPPIDFDPDKYKEARKTEQRLLALDDKAFYTLWLKSNHSNFTAEQIKEHVDNTDSISLAQVVKGMREQLRSNITTQQQQRVDTFLQTHDSDVQKAIVRNADVKEVFGLSIENKGDYDKWFLESNKIDVKTGRSVMAQMFSDEDLLYKLGYIAYMQDNIKGIIRKEREKEKDTWAEKLGVKPNVSGQGTSSTDYKVKPADFV